MSTTRLTHGTPRVRLTISAALAAATIAGSAQALPAPDERAVPQKTLSGAQLEQQDRLGPKYVTARFPASAGNVEAPRVTASSGRDWVQGGPIGPGVVGLALALVAAAGIVFSRRRLRLEEDGQRRGEAVQEGLAPDRTDLAAAEEAGYRRRLKHLGN
jgi:hypothetical protein